MTRETTALCLSGGGFRASIFHLGALRRLNEVGMLPQLSMLSCVSGGSIIGAHLARVLRPWPTAPLSEAEWAERIVEPFRAFTRRDIRTGPAASRLNPFNWRRPERAADKLADKYQRYLFDGDELRFSDLAVPFDNDGGGNGPEFIFCATDMVFGVNWVSSQRRAGNYLAGYLAPPPDYWTVARAVSASSCFPPVFAPIVPAFPAQDYRGGDYDGVDVARLRAEIRLSDGGLYDNMALQPTTRVQRIFVSDGGGRLDVNWRFKPVKSAMRYSALLTSTIGRLRRGMLIQTLEPQGARKGTYWQVHDSKANPDNANGAPAAGYDPEVVKMIAGVRTDLNRFTEAEFAVLENHGYLRCAEKLERKADWAVPDSAPEVVPPNPTWMDPARAKRGLAKSHARFVLWRGR